MQEEGVTVSSLSNRLNKLEQPLLENFHDEWTKFYDIAFKSIEGLHEIALDQDKAKQIEESKRTYKQVLGKELSAEFEKFMSWQDWKRLSVWCDEVQMLTNYQLMHLRKVDDPTKSTKLYPLFELLPSVDMMAWLEKSAHENIGTLRGHVLAWVLFNCGMVRALYVINYKLLADGMTNQELKSYYHLMGG